MQNLIVSQNNSKQQFCTPRNRVYDLNNNFAQNNVLTELNSLEPHQASPTAQFVGK